MIEMVIFEFAYMPRDFFEQSLREKWNGQELLIDNGKVQVRIPGDFVADVEWQASMREEAEGFFLGAQVMNGKTFEFHEASSVVRQYRDGRQDVAVMPAPLSLNIAIPKSGVDVVVTGPDGKVTHDSKQERINKEAEFALLVAKLLRNKDKTLEAILQAQNRAAISRDGVGALVRDH